MAENNSIKCAACRTNLEEGMDVIQVEEGIIGLRGFVSLEKPLLFCSVDCLRDYFTPSKGGYKLPRRIP